MAKQTIIIRFDPKTVHDGIFEQEIEADVKDGFAIHRHLTIDDLWVVTHVKSGIRCKSYHTKAAAEQGRKLFSQISVADVRFADMTTCEALAVYPLLLDHFVDLIQYGEPDKATMAAAMAHRDYIAGVLCQIAA